MKEVINSLNWQLLFLHPNFRNSVREECLSHFYTAVSFFIEISHALSMTTLYKHIFVGRRGKRLEKLFLCQKKKTFPFHKTSAFLNLKIMRINSGHMLTLCVFLEIALDENLCTWPEILFFITSFTKKLYKKPLANLCMCLRMYLSLALSYSGGMINCNVPQFLSISLLLWSTQKKEENVTFV